MRVAIDYAAGLTQSAGIGRYTRELVRALAQEPELNLILWHGRMKPGIQVDTLLNIKTRVLPIPHRWLTRMWYRLSLPIPLETFLGTIDVVHGPDFVAPPSRAKRIVTIHDLSFLITPEFGHPRLVRYLSGVVPKMVGGCTALITVSEAIGSDITRLYRVEPERVRVIPHGVSVAFKPVPAEKRKSLLASYGVHEPYVLAVGTVEPRKDYPTLLKALELVAPSIPDLQLVVVGATGWLAQPIEALLSQAEQSGRLLRFRNVSDGFLAALYSGALAFVTTSRYEGFNLPLLEAMACGAPVIATAVPAHTEVAGNAALFVRIAAPDDLADAIRTISATPTLAQQLREAGLRRASHYTWDQTAKKHLALYRDVANGLLG